MSQLPILSWSDRMEKYQQIDAIFYKLAKVIYTLHTHAKWTAMDKLEDAIDSRYTPDQQIANLRKVLATTHRLAARLHNEQAVNHITAFMEAING